MPFQLPGQLPKTKLRRGTKFYLFAILNPRSRFLDFPVFLQVAKCCQLMTFHDLHLDLGHCSFLGNCLCTLTTFAHFQTISLAIDIVWLIWLILGNQIGIVGNMSSHLCNRYKDFIATCKIGSKYLVVYDCRLESMRLHIMPCTNFMALLRCYQKWKTQL